MKAFLKFFSVFALCLSTLFVCQAQTSSKVVLKTTAYKLFDYGKQATITTTNATATTIETLSIADDEVGIAEVQVVGFNSATGDAVTGSQVVRYKKTGGTLTLGTDSVILAVEADSGLSSSTYSVTAVSNNIAVKVTGKASTTVFWKAYVRKISLTP